MRSVLLALIALTIATRCWAADALNAWLRVDAYSSTHSLDERDGDASLEVGAKYATSFNEKSSIKIDGKGIYTARNEDHELKWSEAYWRYQGEYFDVRSGQQKITWGKTDGLNPTDFFTAHDYRVLQPFEEDQRLALAAFRLDHNTQDDYAISLIVAPDFTGDKLPQSPELKIREDKPEGINRPQTGLRLSHTGENLDWSVVAFRGYLNTPILSTDQAGLINRYAELNAVGADLAHNFGRIGFRGEMAWLEPSKTNEWTFSRAQLYAVSGLDTGNDNWNINVQVLLHHTPDWQAPSTIIEQINNINLVQWQKTVTGLTSRLAFNTLNQTLEFQILGIHYFDPDNNYLRPLVNYALTDRQRLSLGAEYYTGQKMSLFGALQRNNSLFCEYKLLF